MLPDPRSGLKRRDLLGGLTALGAAVAIATPRDAHAQKGKAGAGVLSVPEYLVRAAMLLDETRRAQDWVGGHPGDVGLASLALELSLARAEAAAQIAAPASVKGAHMHLLMVIASTSASFDATVRGEGKKSAQRMSAARLEEQTMVQALDAQKLKMPTLK
jgi:hypothetical protein